MGAVMTAERPRIEHGNAKRAREIVGLLAGRVLTIEQIATECGMNAHAAHRALWRLRHDMNVEVVCLGEEDPGSAGQGGNHGPYLYTIQLPAGRVCAVDGCGTLLSRRNPACVCALHGGWTWSP
jgi:hypothetical protein